MSRPIRTALMVLICHASLTTLTLGQGQLAPPRSVSVNAAPTLTSVTPSPVKRGQTVDLVLTGTGFSSSVTSINLDGDFTRNRVTYTSSKSITLNVTVAQAAVLGSHSISVTNAPPGGGTSATRTISVENPVPTLSSLNPAWTELGMTTSTTFTGSGFIRGVTTPKLGTGLTIVTTTVNSWTSMTVQYSADWNASTAGNRSITVSNATPGGGSSGSATLTVKYPVPGITKITPASAQVGTSVTATIAGGGFVNGATSFTFGDGITVSNPKYGNSTTYTVTLTIAAGAPVGSHNVIATNPSPTDGSSSPFTFTVTPVPPSITTTSPLAAGTVGTSYAQTFAGSSGTPPYTWTLSSGTLPPGLSLSTGGVLSGTPTTAGAYSFVIRLQDNASVATTKSFSLTINPATQVNGTLVVALQDAEAGRLPPGADARAELYNAGNALVASASASSASQVTFTSVPAGSGYWLKVFNRRQIVQTIWGEEYWGELKNIRIVAGSTTNATFVRNAPYALAYRLRDAVTDTIIPDGSTVVVGRALKVRLKIKSPVGSTLASRSVMGRGALDRDMILPYDWKDSTALYAVTSGDSVEAVFTLTATATGTFYPVFAVSTFVDGVVTLTDGGRWQDHSLFTAVNVTPGPLSVTPDVRPVPSTAGMTTFAVANGGAGTMPWTAVSNQPWATIAPPASGTNTGTITVNVAENTSTTSTRTAVITVDAPGAVGSPKQVTVVQSAVTSQPILVVPTEPIAAPAAGGRYSFLVSNAGTGSLHWTVTATQSWIVIRSASSGVNGDTILVDIAGNPSTVSERTGQIIVVAEGALGSPAAVPVTQRMATPTAPGLLSPAPNARNQDLRPIFTWLAVPGAIAYRLAICDVRGFQYGSIVDDSSFTGTTGQTADLRTGQTYFWHVAAKNASGWGTPSETWSFSTLSVLTTSTTLLAPLNGASDLEPSVQTFRWTRLFGADTYVFHMGTDPSFSTGLVAIDSTVADTVAIVSGMRYAQRYYWRVAGLNSAGVGSWSPVWSLNTSVTGVEVEDLTNAPAVFAMDQNYPNPFNPSTRLRFTVADRSRTVVTVYNMLGEEVATLFDDIAEPGKRYVLTFSGAHVPSGIYISRMSTEKATLVRKMLLLK